MRRSSKVMLLACALVLLAGGALAAYARWVEPRWIETTHHQVVMHGPAAVRPIRIAHLSDLHTRGISDRERRVFRILAEQKPDVIVISGDTVTEGTTPDELRAVLSQLTAPLGVFAVRGNWEYWVRIPREKELYRQAGVRLLQNERVELAPGMCALRCFTSRSCLTVPRVVAAACPWRGTPTEDRPRFRFCGSSACHLDRCLTSRAGTRRMALNYT